MNSSHDHTPAGPARVVLAKRRNAGIQVTLLWAEDTNAVAVLVRDDGTDDQFELSVEPGATRSTPSNTLTRTPRGVASTTGSPTSQTARALPCTTTRQEPFGDFAHPHEDSYECRADSLLTVRWRDRSFVLRPGTSRGTRAEA